MFASAVFLIACLAAAISALIAIQVFLATTVADSLASDDAQTGNRTFVGLSADRYARIA